MEVQLVKREDRYDLYLLHGHKIASTLNGAGSKLSLKNCQAIEYGYDLDELIKKEIIDERLHPNDGAKKEGIARGFELALEILGDKKFSEEDVKKIIHWSTLDEDVRLSEEELFQSLQPNEWDVTVEMEYVGECNGNNDEGCFQDSPGHNCGCFERRPKLDEDGCLILKLKSE